MVTERETRLAYHIGALRMEMNLINGDPDLTAEDREMFASVDDAITNASWQLARIVEDRVDDEALARRQPSVHAGEVV